MEKLNYLEISYILFENRESLLDYDYLKLMNMLKSDYDNDTFLFTKYIIDNTISLDDQVTLNIFVIILKNLEELALKEKEKKRMYSRYFLFFFKSFKLI